MWNANSLVQDLNSGRRVHFFYQDNHYTTSAYLFYKWFEVMKSDSVDLLNKIILENR